MLCPAIVHMEQKEFQNLRNHYCSNSSCEQRNNWIFHIQHQSTGCNNHNIGNSPCKNSNLPRVIHGTFANYIYNQKHCHKSDHLKQHLLIFQNPIQKDLQILRHFLWIGAPKHRCILIYHIDKIINDHTTSSGNG